MTMVSKLLLALMGAGAGVSLIATGGMSYAQTAQTAPPLSSATAPSGAAAAAAYERLGRRIREGIRASRAAKPLPVRGTNGVTQLPIDKVLGPSLFKREGRAPAPPPPQARSLQYVPGCPYQNGMKTASLLRVFADVSWHVCVTDMGMKSLWVGPVELKRTPTSPWMTVLYQAGLADIFVPYHQRTWFRPYDLNPWVFALDAVQPQDAGSTGGTVVLTNETVPTVVTEVRDRGIAWLCKQTTSIRRRGQEFIVWGIADGGNYDNIVQYSFRDDGSIGFRLGNTGYSDPSSPDEPHMHTGLWRVDMDLNGSANDTAYYEIHNEYNTLTASDTIAPVGNEGGFKWIDIQFKSLLIQDASTNAYGHRLGYEFTPAVQNGVARHFGPGEQWTQDDVYVTRYHSNELAWTIPANWSTPDGYLAPTINGESTNNQDLVEWVKASAHHHPTDEDRSINDLSTTNTTGVTLVHWSGFDIEPHNLFNTNPLGGPPRCGP